MNTLSPDDGARALLTLTADVDPEGQASSDLRVGWCLTQELVDDIQARGWNNPYLVLIVRSVTRSDMDGYEVLSYVETSYHVSKLDVGRMHVSFSRRGTNQIIAYVMEASTPEDRQRLMNLRRARDLCALDNAGNLQWRQKQFPFQYLHSGFRLQVEVPAEMFAKEPAPWRKRLVGVYFRDHANDQCHFRKRFWVTASTIVPVLILSMIARIVLLIAGFYAGWDKYTWAHLQPWNGMPHDIFDDDGKFTVFQARRTKYGKHHTLKRRPWQLYVCNQYTIWLAPLLTFLVFNARGRRSGAATAHSLVAWGWWDTFWFANACVLGLTALASVVQMLYGLASKTGIAKRARDRRATARRQAQQEHDWTSRESNALLAALGDMVCDPEQATTGAPNDPPVVRQTVALRFADLKAKFCRPYER